MGQSTAVTLRLCKDYTGTCRIVIADSFFGSCQTAEWLMDELGLYCILAIKTGHRGFPKKHLIERVRGQRFSKAFMKVDVALECGVKPFFAGAFMDKRPLLLVGTCGTSLDAEQVQRDRTEWVEGGFVTSRYNVTMPRMHDTYRRMFNGVDLFNRDCFGDYSLQKAVKTRYWHRRFFLALLGMCETNALKAYRHEVGPMTRFAWLMHLSDRLINNPYIGAGEGTGDGEEGDGGAGPSSRPECGNQEYVDWTAKCQACGVLTHWMCACGYVVCRAGVSTMPTKGKGKKPYAKKCSGYYEHIRDRLVGDGSEPEED